MSLDRFRTTRMVVLPEEATAFQALCAMEENHVGAVLVSRGADLCGLVTDRDLAILILREGLVARTSPLSEVMSADLVTCDIDADVGEVARLMQAHAIRRVPILDRGRPVGLVTLDDLLLDGSADPEDLRAIVLAQLGQEAPLKPAGGLPGRPPERAGGRPRATARAEGVHNRFVRRFADRATRLDRREAEQALLLVLGMLCRRLTPEEAAHLIAQLPSRMARRLGECADGPDRSITRTSIRDEIATSFGLPAREAERIMKAAFAVLAETVAPGQIDDMRQQLPEEMKPLLPVRAGRRRTAPGVQAPPPAKPPG